MNPLLSVSEARQRLLDLIKINETREVPLQDASGLVLAREIHSSLDLPLFSNSSMDGYALRAADVSKASPAQPCWLRVVADIPAGTSIQQVLQAGEAMRIMTGAALPAGANAVVPVEDTDQYKLERLAGSPLPEHVAIFAAVQPGDNVRPQGQDVRRGELVMDQGRSLRPQDLGFLAMLGIDTIPVVRKPKVALLSTGDELIPLGQPLTPGKIYDSNSYTLAAAVHGAGAEPVLLGIAEDREEEVFAALERAVEAGVDLIVSSAGVSVGAFDFVRSVVEQHGKLNFWRVNMRPGKPLVFGSYRGIPFIGLPGNPVSSFVGFAVFVEPAIKKMMGLQPLNRPVYRATLSDGLESDGRESYLRAVLQRAGGKLMARLTGHQGSGNLRSLVQANALLIIPSGVKSLPAGAEVDAWLLGSIEEG